MDDRFDKKNSADSRFPQREERQPFHFSSEKEPKKMVEEYEQEPIMEVCSLEEEDKISVHAGDEKERMPERENEVRMAGRRTVKRKRKKRHLTGLAKGLIVFVIAVVIGLFSFGLMNGIMNPPAEEVNLSGVTVEVIIPEGAGTEEIANILKENDLIGSVFGFKLTSKLDGFDGTYKHGKYAVDTGMTKRQIMELIQSGKVLQDMQIMIPEGYTVKQIAEKVEEVGICTAEEFIEETNTGSFDYDFLKDLPEREYRLEGYLFPDTYFLSSDLPVHNVVDMMLKRFDQMYTKEYQNAVASSGYTLDEIVTLASMVEEEIALPEERGRAAGVMYNRLEQGITLGIDATVLYAVGKVGGELTQADLNTDSPYNTRINYGLPLGPIANPGEASFRAALYPENHKYLYYVVEAAGKSNHVYCETYDEFLKAKAAYNASFQ